MEKFQSLTSLCCPLPIKDVDTDMIIPAQYMTSTSKQGYGEHLFSRLRSSSAEFPLNQVRFKAANILVADENFGCGSSREHAVWALSSWGFKVVIAKSFADIFSSNSAKNGLLLITLEPRTIDDFLNRAKSVNGLILTIDLESQTITEGDGSRHSFKYNSFRKYCLLNGLDDLDYIMQRIS